MKFLYNVITDIRWQTYTASNIKLFKEILWQVDNLFSLLRIVHLMKRIIVN